MADWLVNLIIGLFSATLGFIGGLLTKTYNLKNKSKQSAKGNNNKQEIKIGDISNGK